MKDTFSPFDKHCMRVAIEQAKAGALLGEVPVGSVITYKEKIIAKAHNEVEQRSEATAHSEILCLERAYKIFTDWRLIDCTLYCTLEPCCMCYGALINSRVNRVVFGAQDLRQGACGSWIDLSASSHPIHKFSVQGGLFAEESAQLLRTFFQSQREKNHDKKHRATTR